MVTHVFHTVNSIDSVLMDEAVWLSNRSVDV
jgi:hypothetical protein